MERTPESADTARVLGDFLDGKVPSADAITLRTAAKDVVEEVMRVAIVLGYTVVQKGDRAWWVGIAGREEQALIQIGENGEISMTPPPLRPGSTVGEPGAKSVELHFNRMDRRFESIPRGQGAMVVVAMNLCEVMRHRAERAAGR